MKKTMVTPFSDKLNKILRASGSNVRAEAIQATHELAKALELPLRQGVMNGDILNGMFEPIVLDSNATPEFPLDFLAPGTEKDFVAYTIPNQGYIPQRNIEGDFVVVPVYDIGNAIDWNVKYSRDARWDIAGHASEVMQGGVTKKLNDDGFHCVLGAAVDRNIVVIDSDANAGQFTKRLVSLGKTVVRRNGGGNSTSVNRGKLTDLYMSPEAMEDIRNWNVDQIDEVTRREIFMAQDGSLSRIFGVNLHDIDELGEGQEYQLYATSQLSVTMPSNKVELLVGLDLSKRNSMVMPIREQLQVYEDDTLLRQRRTGLWCVQSQGFAIIDSRCVVLLAI